MHLTRQEMLAYQQQDFQELLRYVWSRSSFYQDFYRSHGVREEDLADLSIEDLPFVSKKMLMDNFDAVVTDSRLRKKELEQWLQDLDDPQQLYLGDFVVCRSSGSSGNVGIFVFHRKAREHGAAALVRRFPPPENGLHMRARAAVYMARHGRFGGVTACVRLPKSVYDVLGLSVLDPADKVAEQLNRFQPDRIIGYSSSVAALAELALQGKLVIHPRTLILAGDLLTQSMERRIQEAWGAAVYVLYATAEIQCIAIRAPGQEEMLVMDDLNILEVLDHDNRPVLPGEVGRVVVTNLHNYALPILRYELGDYAVRGKGRADSPFATIRNIQGRANDALPVTLDNGKSDTIHPIVLSVFYAAGLERAQFISRRQDHVQIHYVAGQDIDDRVRQEFLRILEKKGARRTTFEVQRVRHIDNDPQTGKVRLVRIEWKQGSLPAGSE